MARRFGRDRRGSNSSSSSNFNLQSGGRTRSNKKRGKTKERLLLVVGLVVVVLIVLRKEVTKKKKRIFPNQKLEQGKNNQKGLGLDPRRNHQNHRQQLHFHHHQHNLNQTQSQILISRQVVEGEEKEEEQQEQDKEVSEKEEQSSFHGLNNQYFQQAQDFHQHHQFLYGGGGLESQSSPSQQPPPQPPKKRSYLPSSSSQTKEYASGLQGKMGDTTTTSQNHQTTTTSSRLGGLRNTGVVGEIVEVQGGHIVRSTGRKDRHSKVCTAKGPRDRRVRLSAHTAIQFYDVQDRLGYDRPSKAVDWLIRKAKAAIDELEELPAWTPTANFIPINPPNSEQEDQNHNQHQQQQLQQQQHLHHSIGVGSTSNARRLNDQQQQPTENNSNFLPPSMVSDSIADTIKSFFPMGASTETTSASAAANIQFHHNFPPPDLLSRTSSQSQDLRLSLHSSQDPMLLHHHNYQNQQQQQQQQHNEQAAGLFSGNPQIGFDGSGWSENPPGEMGRFQKLVSWNAGGDTCHSGGGGGAFVFNSPPAQPMFGQSHQLFSQRGPLQSSNTPSFRAWIDQSAFSAASDHHHQNQASLPFHPSSISGIGFASGGGFSSFRIPARIQGEEEEHDGISDKPSSASSDSRH